MPLNKEKATLLFIEINTSTKRNQSFCSTSTLCHFNRFDRHTKFQKKKKNIEKIAFESNNC